MKLHLFDAFKSKSFLGPSLDQSVDEIHAFPAPPIGRNLIQLYLFRQYFFANFFAIGSYVGALRGNNITRPVIN